MSKVVACTACFTAKQFCFLRVVNDLMRAPGRPQAMYLAFSQLKTLRDHCFPDCLVLEWFLTF